MGDLAVKLLSLSSLRCRLMALVFLALAPALGLLLFTAAEQRRQAEAQVRDDTLRLTRLVASSPEQVILGARQLLTAMSQFRAVQDQDPLACSALFANLLRQYPLYANLGAARANGDVFCSAVPAGSLVNLGDRTHFRRALETQDFSGGDYQTGRITGKATLNFGYPVVSAGGAVEEVVFADLDLGWLNQVAAAADLPITGRLTVIDRTGTILARYPDPEQTIGTSQAETPLVETVLRQREGVADLPGLDGVPRVQAFTPVKGTADSVFVTIGVSTAAAFEDVNQVFTGGLVTLGIVGALAMGAAWFGGNVLVLGQVRPLMAATRRLAQGDLTARSGVPYGHGELSDLARGFDDMASALQDQQAAAEDARMRLQELYGDLEQRVIARTYELALAKDLIERERANLVAITTSMSDGLLVLDSDRCVRYCNDQAGQLFGINPGYVVGQQARGVFAQFWETLADPDGVRAAWDHAVAQIADKPSFEITVQGPPRRDLHIQLFDVADVGGQGKGVGIVVRDVTAERDLQRTKDELMSVVSHELRTPLASLVGFAELLLTREYDPAQQRRFLTIISEEGRRLTALINDFLDLQRMESGRQSITAVPTNLHHLLTRAAAAAGDDAARPMVLDVPAELPLVLADPDRVQQVVANLISNARKFSPQGGVVRLSAQAHDSAVQVSVRDYGLGLPPEALPRLFEKFYRVDNTDRRAIKGTGLGLAICQQIVTAHGGRIWAESAGLGHGSQLSFTLPVAESSSIHGAVLVVEDDAGFSRLLEVELAALGLTATRVGSAEAALEQLLVTQPRAVVLDLLLPGLHGEAFLTRLREVEGAPPALPVVVVTVKDLNPTERAALEQLGVVAILRKGPGTASEAAAAVGRALPHAHAPLERHQA